MIYVVHKYVISQNFTHIYSKLFETLSFPFCEVFTSHILTKCHNTCVKSKTIYDQYSLQ